MTKTVNLREIVYDILADILIKENHSHQVINSVLKKYQYLDKQERAFISRLTEGTLEQLIHVDYILGKYAKVPIKKMKPSILIILRMAIYQIKFMQGVPHSAACNEAVRLVEKKSFHQLKGFVNGVLRNIIREIDKITYPSEENEPLAYLSIQYSMPIWILELWLKEYDYDVVKQMCESFINENRTTIRCVKEDLGSVNHLKEALLLEGITVEEGAYLPYALRIQGYDYMERIQAFKKGTFVVQDESSMLVTELAGIKEGHKVLDICAAPGGKTTHCITKLNGSGHMLSRDISDRKCALISENVKRLNYHGLVQIDSCDARQLDVSLEQKIDVLIADLPCSGLGIIGKKTDLKYKASEDNLKSLVNLQREILSTVQAYVKPSGTLMYSTCTINPTENIDNIRWLMKNYPFELISLDEYLPEALKCETSHEGFIQLLPGTHMTDGFFIAKLRRI